jgi:glycosyltransferase involved in cell wall biosynthesis
VHNDWYAREVERRRDVASRLRALHGFDGKTVFLFVGRLVKRKNVDVLIRAIQQLADDDRVALVVAGAGEEQAALRRLAGADPRIVFAGRIAPAQLPDFYAMADVLVLPAAHEPWGLAINEAMAAGLAVIAHRHCGAALDLVEADNGVRLEGFDAAELARAMRELAGDPHRLRAMKSRSVEKIKKHSIEAAACGMIRAVAATFPLSWSRNPATPDPFSLQE